MHQEKILIIGGAAAVALMLVARKTGVNPLTNKPIAKDPLTGRPIVRDPLTGKVVPQPVLRTAPTPGGSSPPGGSYTLPGGGQPPRQAYFGAPGAVRPPAPTSSSGGGFLSQLGTFLGIGAAGTTLALGLRNLLGGGGSANRPSSAGGSSGGSGGGSGSGSGAPGGFNRQSSTSPTDPNSGFVPGTGFLDENGNYITPELLAQMQANPGGYIDENGEYVPPTDSGVDPNAVPTDDMGNPLTPPPEPTYDGSVDTAGDVALDDMGNPIGGNGGDVAYDDLGNPIGDMNVGITDPGFLAGDNPDLGSSDYGDGYGYGGGDPIAGDPDDPNFGEFGGF